MRNNNRIVEVRTVRDCGIGMAEAFTLIELLIAMAIAGVVMGSIYGIFVSSNRSYHTQDRVTEAQQGLRVGLDFMVRDIRMAGFDPLGTVNAGLVSASANSLAVPNRSAGNFCNACVSAAATFGGTDFRTFVTAVASSVTIFMMICCAELPVCGGSPASIS